MAKLKPTEKQKLFVDAYLADSDLNAARAYMQVYTSVKNERVAAANASRLLAKDHVQEYLRKRMRDRERRTEITQDRVLNEIAKAAFADIKEYLSYRTELTKVGVNDNGDPIFDYQPIIDLIDSDEVDGSVIQQVSLSDKGSFTFKLQDKLKALELLGRHLGMWNDKLDITTDIVLDFGGEEDDD